MEAAPLERRAAGEDRQRTHHDRDEERYLVGRAEAQQERTLVPDRCDGHRLDGQADAGDVGAVGEVGGMSGVGSETAAATGDHRCAKTEDQVVAAAHSETGPLGR
ncbi:hypothetical protein GCM10022233_56800 [Streptomyces shaanxiensis]|uniref:Uncharacterized protein n=1 Tax=Streptomyces shaanxiensis TaxID=653357 RepID=A0ABP7VQE5_9ACTN